MFAFRVEPEREEKVEDESDLNFIPTVPTSSFLLRRSRTPSPIRERRAEERLVG